MNLKDFSCSKTSVVLTSFVLMENHMCAMSMVFHLSKIRKNTTTTVQKFSEIWSLGNLPPSVMSSVRLKIQIFLA